MKKTLMIGLASSLALGAFAQGTILFSDQQSDATFHIYTPSTVTPGVEQFGSTATDIPAGTYAFTGGSTLLGGASGVAGTTGSTINYTFGNNFTVELYGAAGTGDAISSLQPLSQYSSTIFTHSVAAKLGTFNSPSIPGTDPGIPGTTANAATVAVACWYNAGGTITSLAAAEAAGVPYGESPAVNLTDLGGFGSPPSTPGDLVGIQSFSLINPAGVVPEPSTIALGVMGIGAFLARRRMLKK